MPQPPLKREIAEEAVARVEAMLRLGYRPQGHVGNGPGALSVAGEQAVREGWVSTQSTFQTRVRIAREHYGLTPDETLYRPRQYQHRPPGIPAMVSQHHTEEPEPQGDPVRVCIIGDAHDSPHLPNKERFYWLGRFAAHHQVEWVVSVGDWMSMDCFSTHHDRATFEGFGKPTFEQDLDSFHASQMEFQRGLGGWKPKKHITLGNHEHRAWRYDNLHPDGLSHSQMVEQAFLQWGWRTTAYGEYWFLQGVGFTHIPLNARGKPLAKGQHANKAMCDTIHGDDHRASQMTDHKSGPFRSPTVYSAATALPPGFIEGYANKGGSTWRQGVCLATIWDGHVREWSFTEMTLLRRLYGERQAA
jgi:hypothetical protein